MIILLSVLFLISGASALIFEALWFQMLGLTLGNSIWSAVIVLSAFMGGLALGNSLIVFRARRIVSPIRCYALLEFIIGVSAVLIVLLLPYSGSLLLPVFHLLEGHPLLINIFRCLFSFLLMLIPATAMGATLPLLVKALKLNDNNYGRVLGALYSWNTLGAVIGVLLTEFILIEKLGIRGAALLAGFLNIAAAAAAFQISQREEAETPAFQKTDSRAEPSLKLSNTSLIILLCGFLTGLLLLALEPLWMRLEVLFITAHSQSFAVMLATVLAGLACGSAAASFLFKKRADSYKYLFSVLLVTALIIPLLYRYLPAVLEKLLEEERVLEISVYLMFPICFMSALSFVMLARALQAEIGDEVRATGLLLLANTLGSMLGAALSGLILIPYLGIEKSFLCISICYLFIAFIVLSADGLSGIMNKSRSRMALAAVTVIIIFAFPYGLMEGRLLNISAEYFIDRGEERIAQREGSIATVQYLRKNYLGEPHFYRLLTNSHSMSSTTVESKRYMKYFAYWPLVVHPGIERALVICYGCGNTAKAFMDNKSLKSLDIVDISRENIEMSSIVFPDLDENPLNDPRSKVYIEDGRHFLLTSRERYDVITGEPPPPGHSGVVNLYTREYFQLIKDRLNEGGISTYWLPVYQMKLAEAKSIMKAFHEVFDHASLWSGSGLEWMMVGVKGAYKAAGPSNFRSEWEDPRTGGEMRSLGFLRPEQFGSFFIADGDRLGKWLEGSLPLVDNYPRRLSSSFSSKADGESMRHYFSFMNSGDSQESFTRSGLIADLWPEHIYRKTTPYFQSSKIINDLLARKETGRFGMVRALHECVNNPDLAPYLPWAFSLDQDTLDIALKVLDSGQTTTFPGEILLPSTIFYIKTKDYRNAAINLGAYIERLSEDSSAKKTSIFYHAYLLYLSGNKVAAKRLTQAVSGPDHSAEEKIEIQAFWDWLTRVLD